VNIIQSNEESPAIEICGIRIFADRAGTHVTGRVVFPAACRRVDLPISYHARRSAPAPEPEPPTAFDRRFAERLRMVQRYDELRTSEPACPCKQLADRVAATAAGVKASGRSVQVWSAKYRDGGEEALKDKYRQPIKKMLTLHAKTAADAVCLCAWWSFRIGGLSRIDHRMMHFAADAVSRMTLPDCLAAVDSCYAWKTDRTRYPFKSFSKFVRYDLEKWVFRAADEEAYRTMLDHGKSAVPLFRSTSIPPDRPDIKQRRAEVAHRPTRRKLRDLSVPPASPDAPRVPSTGPPSLVHTPQPKEPKTIVDALRLMEDRYRRMLIGAAYGDRALRSQAIATFALWWPDMPQTLRHNIEFRVNHHLDREAESAAGRGRKSPEREPVFRSRCVSACLAQLPQSCRSTRPASDFTNPSSVLRQVAP